MSRTRVPAVARKLYTRTRLVRRDLADRRFAPGLLHDETAPELLLSPHFDDAVLDCWGLLCAPGELTVVNVFAGAPEGGGVTLWDSITGASDSAERVRERIAEDAAALARTGRRPHCLPLLDAQYERPRPLRLSDLDALLVREVPRASRVHTTAGIGGHPDHLLTRRYALALHAAGMPVTLHADLPYCVYHGWPHWVDGREPEPHRNVDPFWEQFLHGVAQMPPLRQAHVRRLDDEAAHAKLDAMSTYATQYSALSFGGRDMLADPEIHRFEVSWDLDTCGAQGARAQEDEPSARSQEDTP
jgi:LmbE family N-acetylglucosaminyl deacetylase